MERYLCILSILTYILSIFKIKEIILQNKNILNTPNCQSLMRLSPTRISHLLFFGLLLSFFFSCSKDSDLYTDYILEEAIETENDSVATLPEVQIDLENGVLELNEDNEVTINIRQGSKSTESYKTGIIQEVSQPINGTVTIEKDSLVIYTPLFDFNGEDEFDYTAEFTNEDKSISKITKTLKVTVNPISDVIDDKVETKANESLLIEPLDNDSFNSESKASITEITNTSKGNASISSNNTITYAPNEGAVGIDLFNYTVETNNSDGTKTKEVGNITVTINPITNTTGVDIDYGPLKAFPSAFGGGAYTKGGRGGRVIHVTNLNASGTGSLKEALQATGPRTVVFDVSGNINLGGSDIRVTSGNLTIAGQTAPRGGITFTKGTIYFSNGDNDNIIIRYLRGRPAEATSGEVTQGDAFVFWGGNNDVILDHVSISFGGDQAITFNPGSRKTQRRQTLQRSIIADSYTGIIMGGVNDDYEAVDGISFLNNLVVDISHRTPNMSGNGYFESINNIIYNWQWRAMNLNGGNSKLNHIGNYYKRGRFTEQVSIAENANKIQYSSPVIYTSGNYYSGLLTGSAGENNQQIWTNFNGSGAMGSQYFTSNRYPLLGAAVPLKSAQETYNNVLANVGANKYFDDNGEPQFYLDTYDNTKINNVKNDISTEPKIYSNWVIPNLAVSTRPANYDIDKDGMADAWEVLNGLNPNDPNDGNLDRNNDGYTNLEDFLNQVDF
jgi:hypothetical protein